MISNRNWVDPDAQDIESPIIEQGTGLPVEKPLPIKLFKQREQRPGSYFNMDTSVGKAKYLIGQGVPVWDEESMKAEVQPFFNKFGSGLVSRGTSLIPKFAQNVGHIAGAVSYGMDYLDDPETADPNVIWDNAFVNTMSKMDSGLRESLPINKSYSARNGNLLQQMKDPAFWFDDLFDSFAFLGSAYLTGAGIGAASKALGLGKALAGAGATKEAAKIMGQKVQVYGSTLLNSIGEAGFESKDFKDSEKQKMSMRDYDKPFEMLTTEQQTKINGVVSTGAANVFKGNLGVLIVPNYIQSKFMFGKIGQVASEMRTGVRAGTIASKDISLWGESLKGIGTGLVSEGLWEEGMQHALQTYSTRKESFGQNIDDYTLGIANEWIDNFSTVEGQKNMVLGSLVGSLFGGVGGRASAVGERKQIQEEEDIYTFLKGEMNKHDKWYSQHIAAPYKTFKSTIKQQQEDGTVRDIETESYYNENNETEIDIDKAERMFMYSLYNKLLFDEGMAATVNADNIHLETINKDALARLYFNYATTPGMTNLEEVDDLLMERDLAIPKELAEKGYQNKFTKADIKPLREAFENARNQIMSAEDFKNEKSREEFNIVALKTLFGEQVKRNMYEDYLSNDQISDEQKDDIRKLIKDSERLTGKILEKKTREKLYTDYLNEQFMKANARDKVTQLKKDQQQPDSKVTQKDIERAQYEQDEYFYINGTKNPFSTRFARDVADGLAPDMSNEFGAMYNYFHDIGKNYRRKAQTAKDVEEAVKGRKPISDVINTVVNNISNGDYYSKEDLDKVQSLINQRGSYLNRTKNQAEEWERQAEAAREGSMVQPVDEDGIPFGPKQPGPDFEKLNNEAIKLQKKIDTREALRLDHERSSQSFQDILSNIPELEDKTFAKDQKKTYRKFQREFADQPIDTAKDIIHAARGNDKYNDVSAIDNALTELDRRKQIYSSPGRRRLLTTNEFKGFLEKIDRAIEDLNTLRPKAAEAREKMSVIDMKSRINYSASLFNAIGLITNRDKKTHQVSDLNKDIYSIIEKTIGKDILEGILNEASKAQQDGIEYTYDSTFVEKIIELVKKNNEAKNELNKKTTEIINSRIETFAQHVMDMVKLYSLTTLEQYKKYPDSAFNDILEIIVNKFDPNLNITKANAIDDFFIDKDAIKLHTALKEGAPVVYNVDKKKLLELLETHISLLALDKLTRMLESKIKIEEIIEVENSLLNTEDKIPSNQQDIALREAIRELNISLTKTQSKQEYKGWYYLKGLAGSGKTTIFAKWLSRMMGFKPESVIGLSTHENALGVLKKSLEGVTNTGLVDTFDYQLLKDDKFNILLIDEVARLDASQLDMIAENVTKANETRKKPLRVYVFGDPSQSSNRNVDFPAINNFYGDMINVRHLNPLTAVFRSGNSAIISIQNRFLGVPSKVNTILGVADADLGNPANGVHISGSKADLKRQIAIHQKANQRSRVIVVSNEQDAKFYEGLGVDIMQYDAVAGLQYDEVYVDMDPKDFDTYLKAAQRKFNEGMYTALSRSKDYIFIKSYEKDPGAWRFRVHDIVPEDNKQRDIDIRNAFANRLEFEARIHGMTIKGAGVAPAQALKATGETEEQVPFSDIKDSPAEDEEMSIDNIPSTGGEFLLDLSDGNTRSVRFPSYYPIKSRDNKSDSTPYIRSGSKVKYIRVYNPDIKDYQIWIVAQQINIDGSPLPGPTGNGKWEQIGIMGQAELLEDDFGLDLLSRSEAAGNVSNSLSAGIEGTLKLETGPTILAEGTIRKAEQLSYTYSDTIQDQGTGFLKRLLAKAESIFSSPLKETLAFTIEMFSIKDKKLFPGVPYLIIQRKTTKDGEEHTRKEQFIRLTARKIRNSDNLMQKLSDFTSAIDTFEALGIGRLSEPGVNEFLKRFYKNFEVNADGEIQSIKDGNYKYKDYQDEFEERGFPNVTEEQFNKIAELSATIIPGFYGPGEQRVEVKSQEEMEQYLGPTELTNPDYTYEFKKHPKKQGGYILRKDNKSDIVEYVTDQNKLIAGKGTAQIALNILAKANSDNPWVIKKRITTYTDGKPSVKYITQAKHLLSEHNSSTNYYEHLLKIYKEMAREQISIGRGARDVTEFLDETKSFTDEENITRLETLLLQIKDNQQTLVEGISKQEFDELRKEHEVALVTSEQLHQILTFDQDGNHTSLNLPLMMNGPQGINELGKDINRNIVQLEDLLASKLSSINRTQIQIDLDKKPETAKDEPKTIGAKIDKAVNSVQDKIVNRRRTRNMLNVGQDPGEAITQEEARKLLEKFIPNISKEGKEVLYFVDEMTLSGMEDGRSLYGLYRDEVIWAMERGGMTFKKIIRHETFHKIFNEHLSQRERNMIVNAFRNQFKEYADRSVDEIEELLAEKFQDYQQKKLTTVDNILKRFFNWLAKNLGFINMNMNSLDRFFETIEGGYFTKSKYTGIGITRSMRNIISLYGQDTGSFSHAIDVYRNARAIIQDEFLRIHALGFDGFPVTRREMFDIAKDVITQDYIILLKEGKRLKKAKTSLNEIAENGKEAGYYKTVIDNYNLLVNDIYQNWDFSSAGEITVDTTISTEEIKEYYDKIVDRVNMKEHIMESDDFNQEAKMSAVVKDFLSNIKLATGKYMGWREAYIRTLQLFEGLQPENSEFIKQVEEQWRNNGKEPRSYAIVEYIKNLNNDARRINYGKDGTNLPNTMRFINENLFAFSENKDVSDVAGPAGASIIGSNTIARADNESTREYIIRLSSTYDLNIDDIKGHFEKYMNVNTYRSIINLFNNQKQKNLFLVEKKWEGAGTYAISYIPGSYFGPHLGIESQLKENIVDSLPDKDSVDKFVKGWWAPNKNEFKDNRLELIRSFLKKMGMGLLANNIQNVESDVTAIYNDLEGFISRISVLIGKAKETITQDAIESGEEAADLYYTTEDILAESGNLLRGLSRLMMYSNANLRATNVRDVAKKRKYMWSPSSFAHNVLFSLINTRELKGGSISLSIPNHLRSDYFKHNIFLTGKNKIFSVFDHDGIRNIGFNENLFGIKQKDESTQDFIVRTFVAGFIDRIRYSSEGREKYFQALYPNERNNVLGAKINVLTIAQVRTSIEDAIRQINSSPQLSGIKENNKSKFINLRLLQEVIGKRDIVKKPLSEEEITKYSDKVMDLLKREAEKAADTIIENKVPFDSDMFSMKNVKRILGEDVSMDGFINSNLRGKKKLRSVNNTTGEYLIDRDLIFPFVYSYVANNYINSYFLNQMILGDNNQFLNEEDVMRRFSLATAPGMKPIVNKVFGLPERVKFLIIGDQYKETGDIQTLLENILTKDELPKLPMLMKAFKDNFAIGDGQGFMLPERFEQLKNIGFGSEFSLGKILKPVVYSIGKDGTVRAIKYSSIVLSDELIKEFPSLGILRDNIRRSGSLEAVFGSGVKVGIPEVTASFSDMLTEGYVQDPELVKQMTFEVENDHYRIQLDPKAKIESKVRQPSQLIYLARVLANNQDVADRIYHHMAELERIGSDRFFSKFFNKKSIKGNILNLLDGAGNERAYDILSTDISIDFPAIIDKVIIQLASYLERNLVDIEFSGTKLVLQSEYGVRKFNQSVSAGPSGKLRYYRTNDGRLVAEVIVPRGLLPKEYEKQIEFAIANGEKARDYFDLPDLLGFRIPSSDIHSGIAIKVVGFYDTPGTNVIIAPDLLVALHGSDFDVDSLFVIKRETDKHKKLVGYTEKKGKWYYNENEENLIDINDLEKYHKNGVIHELLNMLSSKDNVFNMLSPIPLSEIKEEKKRVINMRKIVPHNDLSNYNDQITAHETIFGASAATGIFGNAAKALAYMIRTGKNRQMPKLRKEDNAFIFTDKDGKDRIYDTLSVFDETDQALFTSIDGFINASIDNIRELALPVLNINRKTIKGFITLRALGVPLRVVDDILQQPSILEYARKGNYKDVHAMIQQKLGNSANQDTGQVLISQDNLNAGIHSGARITDMNNATNDDGTINYTDYNNLVFQARILDEFKRMNEIGDAISKFAIWLKLARAIPNQMWEIDKIISDAKTLFGDIDIYGNLSSFDNTSFPFDISEFFIHNPHILQAFNSVKKYADVIRNSVKKYHPRFEKIVDTIYGTIDGMTLKKDEAREHIRNEFITYLLSNEIYSGEYKLDKDITFEYKYGKETRYLTGPKAMNQIFIKKIRALKNYLAKKTDAEGFPITNMFLSHLHDKYNHLTYTYDLVFNGGPSMDPMDILDLKKAFIELNKYEVEYDKETGSYIVTESTDQMADNDYSEFQKEFVSHGIMNWGLRFGASNYSIILPEDMYLKADILFNSLMDKFIEDDSEENWKNVEDDFLIQFMVNNGNLMQDVYFKEGSPIQTGTYVNEYGKTRSYYGGLTSRFFYDRSYDNPDKKHFKRFIITKYENRRTVYMRMNDADADTVYYQRIDMVSPFKYYNTSDVVLKGGYDSKDYFQSDLKTGQPTLNIAVSDINQPTFTYNGSDVNEGDIVSFTLHHDVTRTEKQYKRVISKRDNTYIVEPVELINASMHYERILSTADSIIEDVKKQVFKKGTPFRADNKGRGRILYAKHQLAEARTFKNKMNADQYGGYRVWRERQWQDGVEMYLDRDELMRFFARGDQERREQFYKINNIPFEKSAVIENNNNLIIENTVEDNKLEEAVAGATKIYSSEKNMESLIDSMIKRSKSSRRSKLLTTLKKRILQQDLKIRVGDLIKVGKYGEWDYDGNITLDLVNLYEDDGRLDIDKIDRILFHEIVHGLSVLGLLEDAKFSEDIMALINEHFSIDSKTGNLISLPHAKIAIQEYLVDNGYDPDTSTKDLMLFMGLRTKEEFIAELLSNDEFARIMNRVKREGEEKSLLRKIIDKILEFFNIGKDLSYDFLQIILHSPYTPSFTKEGEIFRSASGKAYSKVSMPFEVEVESVVATNVDEVRKAVLERAKKIQEISSRVKVDTDATGRELSTYSVNGITRKIRRITDNVGGAMSWFSNTKIDPNVSFGQHMADLRWGTVPHDHKFTIDGIEQNYDQYKERREKDFMQGMIKGNIMHLYFKKMFNKIFNLGYNETDILKKMNDIASMSEGSTRPEHYSWLEDKGIQDRILSQAGVNILKDPGRFPDALRDIIALPEQSIYSELLGIGGTTDSMIFHSDGKVSIIDWKTGQNFGKRFNAEAMKYGIQDIYISDNQRERAKLQVMWYAFLYKLEFPDMKFRDLMTVWVPGRFVAEREDMDRFVEVSSYLSMIKMFLNDKQALKDAGIDPNVMKKILEKSPKIFNVGEYTDKAGDELFENLKDSPFRPEEEYRRRVNEIQIILGKFVTDRKIRVDELPEWEKKRLAQLYREIAHIKSDPSLQLDVYPQGDIGWATQWIGNYSDVNMGIFQPWVKIRNERWNAYTQKHEMDLLRLNTFVEPILKEYMKGKLNISRGGYSRVANVNYAELFGFMYKEFEKNGVKEERLLTETDPEWKGLNKNKQDLLTFLNNTFASWFVGEKAYLNQQATVMKGKSYSWLDIFNKNKTEESKMKYYPGWFPKTMKTYEEINYEEGAKILGKIPGHGDIMGANIIGRFSAKRIKEAAKRQFTWFTEQEFEMYNDVTMSLPLKYMDNPIVINDRNYTKNAVYMFDQFNKSMLHKQYMDNVYVVGEALKVYLELQKYSNGQPMFENTAKFLEKKLIADIQNRVEPIKYTGKPITFGKANISPDKILEALVHWTSASIMWLRPVQGTGNAIFAKMLTHREALKGTIASKFLHIDGDAIDFTVSDNAFADGVYWGSFIKDAMIGDLRKNKMFLLARKLNYIPDNYDYATNRRFLLSTRNQALSESSMYKFYSIGEEYVSLTTMTAQMKHLKHPKTGKSLWDSYEVRTENGITDVYWIGGTRGYEKSGKSGAASYTPITELTGHEIAKLKKVHERMQGGYRKEEAANLELYVLGKAFVQFKRYFMRLVINALGSKREEVDLGTYKKMEESRIDPVTGEKMDVYEWLARTNEGRWRTLINVILTALKIGSPDYKWSSLSTEQKQNIVDAILSIGMIALSYAGYLALFDDKDDDDTFKKWWMNYIIQNQSQQYNPIEMLRTMETVTRPVSFARAFKFTEAFGQMMLASANLALGDKESAFTQKGQLRGWNEFMRSVPYASAWHDMAMKLQNASQTEAWWTEHWANKWR